MKQELINFFIWFRNNGEKYIGISIEQLIEIYLNEKNTNL